MSGQKSRKNEKHGIRPVSGDMELTITKPCFMIHFSDETFNLGFTAFTLKLLPQVIIRKDRKRASRNIFSYILIGWVF